MPNFGNFWRTDDKKRHKKHDGPPAKVVNVRETLHPVYHALGVNVSPNHGYSTHVYLIFQRFDNMPSGKFDATMSFRTMYNDYKGMKTVDISPASEDADPQFDVNGESLNGVMVARRTFVCKIGWVKRSERRESMYTRVADCLPFPIRGDSMDSEEWDALRAKGTDPRCEWVLKAIRVLKKEEIWEGLPLEQFKERHNQVSGLVEGDELRAWKKRVDWAKADFENKRDRHRYRQMRREIGPEPRPSSEGRQARYLDKIMNDVGAVLYPKHDEEPKKILDREKRTRNWAGF